MDRDIKKMKAIRTWLIQWLKKQPPNPMIDMYLHILVHSNANQACLMIYDYIEHKNALHVRSLDNISLSIEHINWTDVLIAQQQVLQIHSNIETVIEQLEGDNP